MTVAVDSQQANVAKAFLRFTHFLTHVYINDPPPRGLGTIHWAPWPHLVSLARDLTTPQCSRLVILKARQLGLSWLLSAYALWRAMFSPGARVLLLSQGENEATELLDKVKFVYDNLPDWLQLPITKRTETDLEFGVINSEIHALPSTARAGRSFTATLVISDEHSFHPYAAENWAAVEPAVNNGAQFIAVSTANGIGNFFHQTYEAAKHNENHFAWRFLGALLRPGCDMAWYESTKKEYVTRPHLLAQEHPLSDTEAFILTSGVPVFDLEALERLTRNIISPLRIESFPYGTVHIYQESGVGRHYVCGCDVAYGLDTPDAACAQMLDWQTGFHVASLWGHFPPEDLAQVTVDLCKRYNNAFLGVEANGVGQFALRRIEDIGYTSPQQLYYSDWEQAQRRPEMPKSLGWNTDTRTRPVLVAELAEAVHTGAINTVDAETIAEMRMFVHEKGKPQAAEGCHDDRVMALGIAWQMRQLRGMAWQTPRSGRTKRSFLTRR